MLALTPLGGDTTQTKVEMTLPPAGGDVTEGHLKWMRHLCAVEGRARDEFAAEPCHELPAEMVLGLHEIVALAEQADVVDRRPAAQGDFEVVVELELVRRAAKPSVAHRPRAGSPIAIPDGTLDGSGDVAIVSAPLDGLYFALTFLIP